MKEMNLSLEWLTAKNRSPVESVGSSAERLTEAARAARANMAAKTMSLDAASLPTAERLSLPVGEAVSTAEAEAEPFITKRKLKRIFLQCLGAFAAIGLLCYLTYEYDMSLLLASFGASAVLVFGCPESKYAHPKRVIGGHLISALAGIVCLHVFGYHWYSIALTVMLAIGLMQLLDVVHPPGGATAIVCINSCVTLEFLFSPILIGIIWIVLVGAIIHYLQDVRGV